MSGFAQVSGNEWQQVRFRYLADVEKGRIPASAAGSPSAGMTPYLSMEYLRGGDDLSPRLVPIEPGAPIASDHDILLLWDGSNAGEFLRARQGRVSSTIALVKPSRSVESDFFYWACKALEGQLRADTVGMGIPHVDPERLANLRIPLPSARRQRAIARYLNGVVERLDELVAEKNRVLDLLAERRLVLMTRVVTHGLDPAAPVQDSSVPWLGKIPSAWRTQRIAWLFRERDERGHPDLPLLAVSINTGVSVREFSDDRIENTAADFNSYKVARRGDVVFNKMRMWQGAVGIAPQDGLVSPDYVVASPTGGLLPQYANLLFRTRRFSAECARRSHGIVWDRLRLYWDGFRDIVVPVPPLDIQELIADYLAEVSSTVDALASAIQVAIALLMERRAALIAGAVTGRIAVEEAP